MKITDEEVIQEVIEMVIIEMIIIGRMVRITGAETIEAPATTEAETAHIPEGLRTDLDSNRETHLDHHGKDEATLNHPETEIKGLIPRTR